MKPIKNILNLSLSELLYELYNANEKFIFSGIDYYNHIRINTNNLDIKYLYELYSDFYQFIRLEVYLIYYNSEKYNLTTIINDHPYNDTIDYDVIDLSEPKDGVYSLLEMCWDITGYNDNVRFENELGIRLLENYYSILDDIFLSMNIDNKNRWGDKLLKLSYKDNKPQKIQNYQLQFSDLFKVEYRDDEIQSKFSQWLIRERYLNHSNEIICDHIKFARLYYLLREEGIVRPLKNQTNVMRTYFGNFGVKVVESYDPENDAPQVVRKTVTGESAETHEMLGMTPKEKNTLLTIFKPN